MSLNQESALSCVEADARTLYIFDACMKENKLDLFEQLKGQTGKRFQIRKSVPSSLSTGSMTQHSTKL